VVIIAYDKEDKAISQIAPYRQENDIVILKAKGKILQIVKIGDAKKLDVGEKVNMINIHKDLRIQFLTGH
jgi:S1-C subfamily serine protease